MTGRPQDSDRPRDEVASPDLLAGTGATAPETRPTEATKDRPAIEAFEEEGAGVAAKE